MLHEIFLIYLAAGALAGFVAALFGVGGAFTMAPALIIGLPLQGVSDHLVMHISVGTALSVMVATSVYISVLRYRAGDLQLTLLWRFAPVVMLGALAGSLFGDALPGVVLKMIFIAVIALTILRGLFYKGHATVAGGGDLDKARGPLLWLYGTVCGFSGALLGPGPAIITGPYLRRLRYPTRMVAATASAISGPLGVASAVGYIYGGLNEPDLPAYALGYIYGPAFAGLALGAMFGSPLGVRVSHRIADVLVHRLFISYLGLLLAVMLIWGR
ncbi:MAG: sulfite exporter TauE/SafE family protein [Alphaproteobacteria bacterium]